MASNQNDETPFHDSFRAIAFSQLRLLRDLYFNKSDIGRELIRINYSVIPEKALPIMISDKALLAEGMYLIILACHFANTIIICKLSEGKTGEGLIFTQELYDRCARFSEQMRDRTCDSDLQKSIDFVCDLLKGFVGFSAPQLLRFLEASTTKDTATHCR